MCNHAETGLALHVVLHWRFSTFPLVFRRPHQFTLSEVFGAVKFGYQLDLVSSVGRVGPKSSGNFIVMSMSDAILWYSHFCVGERVFYLEYDLSCSGLEGFRGRLSTLSSNMPTGRVMIG